MDNIQAFLDTLQKFIKSILNPKTAFVLFLSATIYIYFSYRLEVLKSIQNFNYIPVIMIMITSVYLLVELLILIFKGIKNRGENIAQDNQKYNVLLDRLDAIMKNPEIYQYENAILYVLTKNNIQEFSHDIIENLLVKENMGLNYNSERKSLNSLKEKGIFVYASRNPNWVAPIYRITDIAWCELRNWWISNEPSN